MHGETRTRVDRILRLVLRQAADVGVTRESLEAVFRLTDATADERVHVLETLSREGVHLGAARTEPRAESESHAQLPAVPPGQTGISEDDAARARREAVAVLDLDRHRRSPWNRLLTATEEIGLALLMRPAGAAIHEELPRGYRASLDEGELRARAFDAMVEHNIKLVWSIALGHAPSPALETEDVVQNGVIGLIRAVEKFDASLGLKFSTYATWWIRQSITRARADTGDLIRLPVHVHETMGRVRRVQRELWSRGDSPTAEALALELGLEVSKVRSLLRLCQGVVSLNRLMGDGTELEDYLVEAGSGDPAEAVDRAYVREAIEDTLALFKPREAHILRMRFGVDTDEAATLATIGDEIGVTRERVRQIEAKCLERFRQQLMQLGLRPA